MFCPKCGSLLIPKGGKMTCPTHGAVDSSSKLTEKSQSKLKNVKVGGDEPEVHPRTKEKCPKCGHDTAYFWTVQTRSIDESPTRFYKCTKCNYQWREYS
jgi:DNA-directed RNA polymerase subunit M